MIQWIEPTLFAFEATYGTYASNSNSTSGNTIANDPGASGATSSSSSATYTLRSEVTVNEQGISVSWSSLSSSTFIRTASFYTFDSSGSGPSSSVATSSGSGSSSASNFTPALQRTTRETTTQTTTELLQEVAATSTGEVFFQTLETYTLESEGSTLTDGYIQYVSTTAPSLVFENSTTAVNTTVLTTEAAAAYVANAANTVYLAAADEVLAVGENKLPSDWNNAASAASFATAQQTTISASVENVAIELVNASAATKSYQNSSSQTSAEWTISSFTTTTSTELGNLFQSDNSRTMSKTTWVTASSSWSAQLGNDASESGLYATATSSYSQAVVATISKWRSSSFQSTSLERSFFTITTLTTAQTTDATATSDGGTTHAAGGNTTRMVTGVLGVEFAEFYGSGPVARFVYGPEGFSIGNEVGGRPVFNNSTAPLYVSYARKSRSNRGLVVLLPETDTQFSYTCDGSAYTLIAGSGSNTTLDSAVVSVDGNAQTEVLHSGSTLGGTIAAGETALHTATPGVYSDLLGSTYFCADDSTFVGSAATSFLSPVPYFAGNIVSSTPVGTFRRNFSEIPPQVYDLA